VQVLANGEPVRLSEGATVNDLIEALGLGAKFVVAELNGQPVDRSDMPRKTLNDGDKVELVRAVAGG
jgi:sulfur carrier protein